MALSISNLLPPPPLLPPSLPATPLPHSQSLTPLLRHPYPTTVAMAHQQWLMHMQVSVPYLRSEYGKDYDFDAPVKLLDSMMHAMADQPNQQVVVLGQVSLLCTIPLTPAPALPCAGHLSLLAQPVWQGHNCWRSAASQAAGLAGVW